MQFLPPAISSGNILNHISIAGLVGLLARGKMGEKIINWIRRPFGINLLLNPKVILLALLQLARRQEQALNLLFISSRQNC